MPDASAPRLASLREWTLGSALNLAVMRITVAVTVLLVPELHTAAGLTDSPLATVAWAAAIVAALAGAVGVRAQLSFAVLTASCLYLFGLHQQVGSTVHLHHLVWFTALLAVSPCGDALAPGAPTQGPRSIAHGLPIRVAWLLLGAVYFFPGLHKLLAQGLWWDPTDQMYWKWAQSWAFEPAFRIDRHPALVRACGAAVVLFELGFGTAVLFRRTRPLALVAALAFHAATALFFDIHFASLWLCYPLLVDWDRWVDAPASTVDAKPWWPTALVAVPLLAAVVFTGIRGQTQGWPVACYPTFAAPVGLHMPAIELTYDDAGTERALPMSSWADDDDAQRLWGEVWAISGVTGPVDPVRLEALWDRVAARNDLDPAAHVRFYRATRDVRPDIGGTVRGPLIYERSVQPSEPAPR